MRNHSAQCDARFSALYKYSYLLTYLLTATWPCYRVVRRIADESPSHRLDCALCHRYRRTGQGERQSSPSTQSVRLVLTARKTDQRSKTALRGSFIRDALRCSVLPYHWLTVGQSTRQYHLSTELRKLPNYFSYEIIKRFFFVPVRLLAKWRNMPHDAAPQTHRARRVRCERALSHDKSTVSHSVEPKNFVINFSRTS